MLAVHHLAVLVRDLEGAEAFYTGVLGLAVRQRWNDEAGRPRSVWVELGGGAFLAIERAGENAPAGPGHAGWHCVALGITATERAAWRARLEAAGVAVVRESPYTMYVQDPEGNLVALSHHPTTVT